MVMKQQIIDAFALIGVSPDAPEPEASKAYKQLALRHHPDKNQGSTEATERFQQLGEAWHICQKHYEFPHLSHENVVPNHQAFQQRSWDPTEDVPLDPEEAAAFFDFLFKATMQGRYSFGSGQRYRRQRAGGYGGGVHMFSGGFAESQARQKDNELRQKREKMEYEQRVREFEAEIAAEVKAAKAAELEAKKNAQRLTDALRTAFTAARAGKGQEMQAIFTRHDLPVMFPERVAKGTIIYQQSNPLLKGTKLPDRYDTILHAAASRCDVASVVFLLKRGADASFRNSSDITALHSAILTGNVPVISHFLSLHPRIEGCHPSKAAGVPSRTPLEMAIHSGDGACVDLMVKFATVHDVQKQWELLCQDDRHNLKSILEKKKAFSPANDGLTVKQRRKLEEEQAKAKKEQLLREERQRAEANRQRKESNKAKLEQQKEQERLKQLEEEVKRQEQERKRVEEEQRRNEEKRKKREEQRQRREADARRDEEERQRKEADLARQRLEAQQKKQREQEDLQRRRKEAEERRLAEAAREEARRKEELSESGSLKRRRRKRRKRELDKHG
ncbi:hypothetical protein C8J56DRAFT_366833 [Mycena floridula]|nr:hypothetical protein C8J56DRAFT_366833 [Mycena floridula]